MAIWTGSWKQLRVIKNMGSNLGHKAPELQIDSGRQGGVHIQGITMHTIPCASTVGHCQMQDTR